MFETDGRAEVGDARILVGRLTRKGLPGTLPHRLQSPVHPEDPVHDGSLTGAENPETPHAAPLIDSGEPSPGQEPVAPVS
ncbi:hypothetical protein GCM10009828_019770 [Actinoplanes couchii]|uniref:Uncharacterized protein n=1 Tax=Actinoplanes couchii TaxID=403638 RepID=A0ABQ3XDM6_9ACTN|nr:hypothetical protein Aco03nite_049920 [Actinoplanes couchii]